MNARPPGGSRIPTPQVGAGRRYPIGSTERPSARIPKEVP